MLRETLNADIVQGFEECREGIGIGRIESAADRQATECRVVDGERLIVVAIELIGHRTERTLLEDLQLECFAKPEKWNDPGFRVRPLGILAVTM